MEVRAVHAAFKLNQNEEPPLLSWERDDDDGLKCSEAF